LKIPYPGDTQQPSGRKKTKYSIKIIKQYVLWWFFIIIKKADNMKKPLIEWILLKSTQLLIRDV